MKALDTNILVRFLIKDNIKQAELAKNIINNAENTKQPLFVTWLVVLELLWVLDASYNVSRSDIIEALNNLMQMPALQFEKQSALRRFIISANKSNLDLSDILIALSAVEQSCKTTLTFDKKAAKFSYFEKV